MRFAKRLSSITICAQQVPLVNWSNGKQRFEYVLPKDFLSRSAHSKNQKVTSLNKNKSRWKAALRIRFAKRLSIKICAQQESKSNFHK
jgi:hypothetical protein